MPKRKAESDPTLEPIGDLVGPTEQNRGVRALTFLLGCGEDFYDRCKYKKKRPKNKMLPMLLSALDNLPQVSTRCEELLKGKPERAAKRFDVDKDLIQDPPKEAKTMIEDGASLLSAESLLFTEKPAGPLWDMINVDQQLRAKAGPCLRTRLQNVLEANSSCDLPTPAEFKTDDSAGSASGRQHAHISAAPCTPASATVSKQECAPSCAAGSAQDQAGVGGYETAEQVWVRLQSLPAEQQAAFSTMFQGSSMAAGSKTLPDKAHSAQNAQDSKLAVIEQLLREFEHLGVIKEAHVRKVLSMIQEKCHSNTPQQIIKLICKAVGNAVLPGGKARCGGRGSVFEVLENILSAQNNDDDDNVTWQDILDFLAEVGRQQEDDDMADFLDKCSRSTTDFSNFNQDLWNSLHEFFKTLKNISDEDDEDESDDNASLSET